MSFWWMSQPSSCGRITLWPRLEIGKSSETPWSEPEDDRLRVGDQRGEDHGVRSGALRPGAEPGEDEARDAEQERGDPVLHVMVARPGLVAREEAGQRLRRLGPVHDARSRSARCPTTTASTTSRRSLRIARSIVTARVRAPRVTKSQPPVHLGSEMMDPPAGDDAAAHAGRPAPDAPEPGALVARPERARPRARRRPGPAAARAGQFCGIFSSNLDEFFMVRVAGLLDQVAAGLGVRSPDGRTPQQTLDGGARARARR